MPLLCASEAGRATKAASQMQTKPFQRDAKDNLTMAVPNERLLWNILSSLNSPCITTVRIQCKGGALSAPLLLLAAASPVLREAMFHVEEIVVSLPWADVVVASEAIDSLLRAARGLSREATEVLAALGVACCRNLLTKKDKERKLCEDQSSTSTQFGSKLTVKDTQLEESSVSDGRSESQGSVKAQSSIDLIKAVPKISIEAVTADLDTDQFDQSLSVTNNEVSETARIPVLEATTNLCVKCGKTFYDKRELKLHEVAIHKEKNMPCRICSKLFPSEKHRDKHEKTVHATEQAYQCDECPRNYKHPSSLHKHRLSQHRDREERKFKCGYCGKAFITKEKLKTHERTHTGERCHGCSHCGMLFTDQSSLARHRKIHEGGSKYQCDLCPKEYSQSYDVVKHKLVAHGVQTERGLQHPNKGKKFSRDQKPGRFSEEVLGLGIE